MKNGLFVLVLLGLGGSLRAQTPSTTTLTGRVTDAKTGQALAFASVYVNATTRGTTTDDRGNYQLTGVPLGTIEIVASYVGYTALKKVVRLTSTAVGRLDLSLQPGIMLQEATVATRQTGAWKRRYERFERELLGNTPFLNACTILNKSKVELTEAGGKLRATASEPLVIENRALGYRLRYDLASFEHAGRTTFYGGSGQFEELKPTDAREATRWQRNRLRAYKGSTRHLLTSMQAGTTRQEGFDVFLSNLAIPLTDRLMPLLSWGSLRDHATYLRTTDILFRPGELAFERYLVVDKPLEIFYTRIQSYSSPYPDMPYVHSILTLPRGRMLVTTDGRVPRPEGMVMRGHLGDDRLSSLLPDDWRPDPSLDVVPAVASTLLPADARLDSLVRTTPTRFRNRLATGWLHTDKLFYATGDILHLSAFLPAPVQAENQSEALHAELFDPAGRLVQHHWLRAQRGWAAGDFRLSDTLGSGTYRLRVYPLAGRAGVERTLVVYNVLRETPKPTGSATRLTLRAEPENGRWVVGLPAVLRLATEYARGPGRSTLGLIRDDRDSVVARFATNAEGISRLVLTPEAGRRYRADVRTLVGDQEVALPSPDSTGLVLETELSPDSTQLLVHLRGTGPYASAPVYVLGLARNGLRARARLRLTNGEARLALPLDAWPSGTGWLALFDSTGREWAERSVQVPDRLASVALELLDKPVPGTTTRDTVQLALRTEVESVLSVSVSDAAQVPADDLDVPPLLDAAGWSRPDSGTGLSLHGRVLDLRGRLLPSADLLLTFTNASAAFARSTRPDSAGRFRLLNLDWSDSARVQVRVMHNRFQPMAARVELERPGALRADSTQSPDWERLEPWLRAARIRQDADPERYRQRDARQLAEVVVRGRRPPDDTRARRASIHGTPDRAVDFDEVAAARFANTYEMLRMVPSVQVSFNAFTGTYAVTIRGGILSFGPPQAPMFLLDGVVFDDLYLITPREVERVEVVMNSGAAMYGARGAGGVIAFFSRLRRNDVAVPETNTHEEAVLGFATPRPLAPLRGGTEDRRDVLAWLPQVRAEAGRRLLVPVVLSNAVRTLRVTIRGISDDGQPIAVERVLSVR